MAVCASSEQTCSCSCLSPSPVTSLLCSGGTERGLRAALRRGGGCNETTALCQVRSGVRRCGGCQTGAVGVKLGAPAMRTGTHRSHAVSANLLSVFQAQRKAKGCMRPNYCDFPRGAQKCLGFSCCSQFNPCQVIFFLKFINIYPPRTRKTKTTQS